MRKKHLVAVYLTRPDEIALWVQCWAETETEALAMARAWGNGVASSDLDWNNSVEVATAVEKLPPAAEIEPDVLGEPPVLDESGRPVLSAKDLETAGQQRIPLDRQDAR